MEFADVIKSVAIALQAHVPVLLQGNPGEAKTRILDAIMRQVCADSHTSIVALHEPPEYGGYPVPTENGVRLLPLAWVNRLALVPKDQIAGLFLDELSNGAPATRAAAMRGVLDGTWGEKKIEALSTAAAMNPPEIAESGYDLSAPLANRFCHVAWDMPVAYWVNALIANFPDPVVPKLPDTWREHKIRAKTLVAAFAAVKPDAIKAMPGEASARSGAWPSFRTWTMAIDLLAACFALGHKITDIVPVLLIGGCVGTGAATEFLEYAQKIDLPDPEDIIADPSKLVLPERGDRVHAVLTSVMAAVLANNTPERWTAGWKVLEVAANQGKLDVATPPARMLATMPPKTYTPPPQSSMVFYPILKAAGLIKE